MTFAELTQAALLGTERQQIAPQVSPTPLGQLKSRVDLAQREQALLSLAALCASHERIGMLPISDMAPMPQVCAAEEHPRAGQAACSLLQRLVGGEFPGLLNEWLTLCARAGMLAPPESLPALLDAGAAQAEAREPILPVLGARGRWLAAQKPEWNWVLGAATDDESPWQLGERLARLLFLKRLRRSNPGRARELLAATWKEETPEDRAIFVPTLEEGLGAEDEPFLESALDDKRKEVRKAAAALLARLPNSGLVHRVKDRVKPLLKFIPGEAANVLKLRKSKPPAIEVTLLAECDKAMQRDGVEFKPQAGFGEKAWWLTQLLELTPLELWTAQWKIAPAEILTASQRSEWKKELFDAWARAAARQRNANWASVLFDAALEAERADLFAGLLAAMPPEQREARLIAVLNSNDKKIRELHGTLVAQCRHPWSLGFSRAVMGLMRREAGEESGNWPLRNQFKDFASLLAPEALVEAANGWPTQAKGWEFWSKGVDEFLSMTQFRADMRAAFKTQS